MLLRRPIREHQGRSMVLLADPTCIHFHYAHGFATQKLAHMLDSLVRVSRRVAYNHYASILAEARTSVPAGRITPWAITHPRMPHSPYASPTTQTNAGLLPRNTPSKSQAESQAAWLTSSASLSTISRTFNSLSKVLFIFRSLYLCAIGLSPIFSFRRNLPPI